MTVMTEAQLQTTINDMIATEIRKQVAARDEQQPAGDVDAEVEKELVEFAKAVDAHSGLREAMGGAPFMDAFDGRAGEKAERAANVIYRGFCADEDWPVSQQVITDFVADVGEQTEELKLCASPLSMTDAVVEAELSEADKALYAMHGEEGVRDPFQGSDWIRDRQQQRVGLERLAAGREVENEAETGPVVVIGGRTFGGGEDEPEAMSAGFGDEVVEHDAQDREQDFKRRMELMRRDGRDRRTFDEVAAGVELPGETPQAADAQPPTRPLVESWAAPWAPLPTRAPRVERPAVESETASSAASPGELSPDSEYQQPKGPGWAAFDLPGHR